MNTILEEDSMDIGHDVRNSSREHNYKQLGAMPLIEERSNEDQDTARQ
jgi:hypothetical protein